MTRAGAARLTMLSALLFAGCSSQSGSFVQPGPHATAPPSFARMFQGYCSLDRIFILAPPLVPSAEPAGAIAQPCGNSIAFERSSGTMAVSSGAQVGVLSIRIYEPPYSGASLPSLTFTPKAIDHPRQVAWDGLGNLWLADDGAGKVFEFQAPLSVTSEPAAFNADATQPAGLAVDADAGRMFVGDLGGERTCAQTECRVYVIPAPYTGKPSAVLALGKRPPYALAVDRLGRLFVGVDESDTEGSIEVYLPPFSTGERAAYTLNAGDRVRSLAFDPHGNLFAQRFEGGSVVEFDAPIDRSAAAPSRVLGCPKGIVCSGKNWAGLAFGP